MIKREVTSLLFTGKAMEVPGIYNIAMFNYISEFKDKESDTSKQAFKS